MTTQVDTEPVGNDSEVIAAGRQPALALEQILTTNLELYINFVGQPTIGLPNSLERPRREYWPLRSERIKAWVAEFVWDQFGVVLAEREIDRIVTVLVGKAWHDQRHDIAVTEAMDQDPLLEALLILMQEHAVFDKSCTALKAELDHVARAAGLDTKDRLWPKGAPQLSRRIEELKPFLKRAGVTAELGRRSGGHRFVKLTCEKSSGGDVAGPPPSPSIDNSHYPREIHRHDDGDGDSRRMLFDLLRNPKLETNDEGH